MKRPALVTYFAYGSNMSLARLRARTPSAQPLGCYRLRGHALRFHKAGRDGSGKCDAWFTGEEEHAVFGALFQIHHEHKARLDRAEGLGHGYDEKTVTVYALDGRPSLARTYVATAIDASLKPYDWYLEHVILGARETALPEAYIRDTILSINPVEDRDQARAARERAIHRGAAGSGGTAPGK